MRVEELLRLIPANIFSDLAAETKVDHQVKKLSGESIFKLILFSMLNSEKLSLRVMEGFMQSAKFKKFIQQDDLSSKYNSIRDRICTINATYFEQLFEKIFSIYNKELNEEKALSKTDSTYVALAAKLFSSGMLNGDKKGIRFIKYSVNLTGSIPSKAKVFTQQSYISEDLALTELIEDTDNLKNNVVVFDRGLQSRRSFEKFTGSNKFFVSRAHINIRCKIVAHNTVNPPNDRGSVTITSDVQGLLMSKKHSTQYEYRVIKGVINATGEQICFVTNILDENAYQIADWYKQRWEIEVFFKFIKQHLNVKHLVSRNENGIRVMLYMTMILAILIITYKKLNKIKGFKIAKLKFEIELENELIKDIVILCGGNPDLAKRLWNTS